MFLFVSVSVSFSLSISRCLCLRLSVGQFFVCPFVYSFILVFCAVALFPRYIDAQLKEIQSLLTARVAS